MSNVPTFYLKNQKSDKDCTVQCTAEWIAAYHYSIGVPTSPLLLSKSTSHCCWVFTQAIYKNNVNYTTTTSQQPPQLL